MRAPVHDTSTLRIDFLEIKIADYPLVARLFLRIVLINWIILFQQATYRRMETEMVASKQPMCISKTYTTTPTCSIAR